MIYTKSGKFAVVDITDPSFCPGVPVPQQFENTDLFGGDKLGTFFFMPAKWTDPNADYGSFMSARRKHPMNYSPGYEMAEKAFEAAEKWEASGNL